jgi:hypothetical protein
LGDTRPKTLTILKSHEFVISKKGWKVSTILKDAIDKLISGDLEAQEFLKEYERTMHEMPENNGSL